MQELGKLNLEVNVTPNGLEKYASFSINNKSKNFVDSFQCLISPLDSLVKNLNQDILTIWAKNLIKTRIWSSYTKKEFYPYEYFGNFKKFKEQLPNKEQF